VTSRAKLARYIIVLHECVNDVEPGVKWSAGHASVFRVHAWLGTPCELDRAINNRKNTAIEGEEDS
jgi:hypothetical protein